MSEDKVLPAIFARKTIKKEVLVVSLTAFSAICVITLLFAKTFDQILSFTIFLDSMGMATSAGALFILRKRTRHLDDTGIYKNEIISLTAAGIYCGLSLSWPSASYGSRRGRRVSGC